MTGDIVILSPAVALKEGLPIEFSPATSETDDRRQMVEEHRLKVFGIEQILRHRVLVEHGEIVL